MSKAKRWANWRAYTATAMLVAAGSVWGRGLPAEDARWIVAYFALVSVGVWLIDDLRKRAVTGPPTEEAASDE